MYNFYTLHVIYKYGRGPINVTWLAGHRLETPDLTYKNNRRVSNTHCFSTATMVAPKRVNVTLYVHCLYCRR